MKNEIKEVFDEMMDSDEIKEIIHQNLKQTIKDTIDKTIRNGEVGRKIRQKIEEILIEQIEVYDFDCHLIKLDSVLTDIMNTTTIVDNKKILQNFRYLMIESEKRKIKISEIFKKYKEFVKTYAEIEEITAQKVNVTVGLRMSKNTYKKNASTLTFYVDNQDDLERKYTVMNINDKTNNILNRSPIDVMSLRYIPRFDLFMEKIKRQYTNIIIDTDHIEEVIEIENE